MKSASRGDIPNNPNNSEDRKDRGEKAEHPKSQVWEWLLIALICIACLGYWASHYKKFYRLEPDYHSFEETARDIWSGRIPSDFKRMPLFPAIFGGLAQVLPSEEPYLDATLILSMLFSAAVLAMLYLFLRGLIGRAAIAPVGFMAYATLFLDQGTLPLVEPFMLFMILLTFWLFAKGSRWQYVAAFFTALTRYEASALIFIIFLLNNFSLRSRLIGDEQHDHPQALFEFKWGGRKEFVKQLAYAAMASTGFIIWMALSLARHDQGNPHIELMAAMGWPTRPQFIVKATLEPFYTWAHRFGEHKYATIFALAGIAVPCVYGLWISMRRFARISVAIMIFAFLYVLAQVIYGIGHWRYIYPVLWIPPLYFTVGWTDILSKVDCRILKEGRRRIAVYILTAVMVVFGVHNLYSSFHEAAKSGGTAMRPLYVEVDGEMIPTPPEAQVSNNNVYPAFWLVVASSIFLFGLIWGNKRGVMAVLIAFLIATVVGYSGARSIRRHADVYSWRRWNRYYQFLLAGRWLEENLQPGESAAVLQGPETRYATDLPKEAVVRFSCMEADNLSELKDAAEEWGVTYIIYTWRDDLDKDEEPWSWVVTQSQRYDLIAVFGVDEDLPGFEFVENLGWIDERSERAPRVFRYVGRPDE